MGSPALFGALHTSLGSWPKPPKTLGSLDLFLCVPAPALAQEQPDSQGRQPHPNWYSSSTLTTHPYRGPAGRRLSFLRIGPHEFSEVLYLYQGLLVPQRTGEV